MLMMKRICFIFFLIFSASLYAERDTRWVEIGEGTYEQGFLFPYKIKLSVPYGVKNIDEIKQGLFPVKIELDWLLIQYSKEDVGKLFYRQFKDKFKDKEESFRLSQHMINMFLNKLPSVQKHDHWTFIYYPDEGMRLFIDGKKIYHLVGAELNRALLQSWLSNNPVLTSKLFSRILKIK